MIILLYNNPHITSPFSVSLFSQNINLIHHSAKEKVIIFGLYLPWNYRFALWITEHTNTGSVQFIYKRGQL